MDVALVAARLVIVTRLLSGAGFAGIIFFRLARIADFRFDQAV